MYIFHRFTKQFPNTNISMLVRKEQANACSGAFTIGSFSLKLVLNKMGTSFCKLKCELGHWNDRPSSIDSVSFAL
jgi:hypothetical protein